ncbi:MAG: Type 1 glutamine amidotransferase-like domain-containing protein [Chloroflexota bacterium]|nr:Type 1 glutamine amidotransferase-like domain-containing protein [Chloroflexota bacterium]MDQ5864585.1 Type 1 glutamine amidotransferase-like domain-containing protein [Chloroflexota bacterium]
MKEPRVMLAGGGSADDSRQLDTIFAAWTGRSGRMLYLPIAMGDNPHTDYDSALDWVSGVFKPLGVGEIEMWTTFEGHTQEELGEFDSVYIGGGNTFLLMDLLRSSGFDRYLADYVAQGGAVYGGSAGAVVLGRNVLTASRHDPNDVALTDTRGLDLVGGHAIWVHYREEDDPLIYEYIHKYMFPVLALTERGGVGVEAGRIIAWGHEPVYRFTRRRKREIKPGEQV